MPTTEPVVIDASNRFDALSDDSKSVDARTMKDDVKQQAFELKNQVKQKGVALKEQLVSGIEAARSMVSEKLAHTNDVSGRTAETGVEQEGNPQEGEWQTVQRRGGEKAKKQMTGQVDATIEQVERTGRQLKKKAARLQQRGQELASGYNIPTSIGQLRGFIRRNRLSVPLMVIGICISLWMCLSVIHWMTTPSKTWTEQKIDQSKEWLDTLRQLDQLKDMKDKASDYSSLFGSKYDALKHDLLGRAEHWTAPSRSLTWNEWFHDKSDSWIRFLTGRPQMTELEKIQAHLKFQAKDLKNNAEYYKDMAGAKLGGMKDSVVDGVLFGKHRIEDSVLPHDSWLDRLKSHLPGQHSTVDDLKGRAESLKDELKWRAAKEALEKGAKGAKDAIPSRSMSREAEYYKNRAVHGTQEMLHNIQDTANELLDKAKRHLP